MTDTLTRICNSKREHIAQCKQKRSIETLYEQIKSTQLPRGFHQALKRQVAQGEIGLITEIKKASPSKGLIREDFHPSKLANAYAEGGATCLSVLTDAPYFQGSDEFLVEAREACPLPVLRKDFMLDPYQVIEARALGADCILLIMAALSDGQATELEATAHELGMSVLIEVHDTLEMERALRMQSKLLGVNNRNLKTLEVDLTTIEKLAALIPNKKEYTIVCESGIRSHADIQKVRDNTNTHCFLVGESLMLQRDVASATRTLLS